MKKKSLTSLSNSTAMALAPLRRAESSPRDRTTFDTAGVGSHRGAEIFVHQEVEGVHFTSQYLNPSALGARLLSTACFRALTSGIIPQKIQVSLGLHSGISEPFLQEVFRGMDQVARKHRLSTQLGVSTHSPRSFFVTLLIGGQRAHIPRKTKAGDLIAVTGTLGDSAAGLYCLQRLGNAALKDHQTSVYSHLQPKPAVQASFAFAKRRGSPAFFACIDGLSADLHRLCEQVRLTARLQEKAIPISTTARETAAYLDADIRRWALFGAEDYRLILVLHPSEQKSLQRQLKTFGETLTIIGGLESGPPKVFLENLEGKTVTLANRRWNPLVRQAA